MAGIRIDQVCGDFAVPNEAETNLAGFPKDYVNTIRVLCWFAKEEGPSEMLSPKEAARAQSLDDRFQAWGGANEFAKLIKQAPRPQRRDITHTTFWNALYQGFKSVSLREPPFLTNGYQIQKIAETGDSQTLRINDAVFVQMSYDPQKNSVKQITVNGKKAGNGFLAGLDTELNRRTGRGDSLSEAFLSLPFMERYQTSDQPLMVAGQFNAASVNHPLTKIKRSLGTKVETEVYKRDGYSATKELPLFLDGFGRPFVEEGKTRYYQASLTNPGQTLYVWKDEGARIALYPYEEKRPRYYGFSCFTGNSTLKTQSGQTISLATLYQKFESGEVLPEVAVYNPDTKNITYQTPAKVARRLVDGGIHLISYRGGYLEVTGNHYLWMKRLGKEYWISAEHVQEGDALLVGESGSKRWVLVTENFYTEKDDKLHKLSFSFKALANRPAQGALDVYDLSFEGENKEMYHNFAVSAVGSKLWVVAHNSAK